MVKRKVKAARVRETKEKHPERYCANTKCLWNISTGKPCPKHPLINNMCGMTDQFIVDEMHTLSSGAVTDTDKLLGVS